MLLLLKISLSLKDGYMYNVLHICIVRLIYGTADCRTMELENPVELKLPFSLQLHLKVQCYKVYTIKICNKKLYVMTKITLILVTNIIILFLVET